MTPNFLQLSQKHYDCGTRNIPVSLLAGDPVSNTRNCSSPSPLSAGDHRRNSPITIAKTVDHRWRGRHAIQPLVGKMIDAGGNGSPSRWSDPAGTFRLRRVTPFLGIFPATVALVLAAVCFRWIRY
ncbi:MAG: hypothetical protein IPN71_08895 [Fibrobacteres bacterium]|nr:hypothetical protein [Fibrobacterota bacterium]